MLVNNAGATLPGGRNEYLPEVFEESRGDQPLRRLSHGHRVQAHARGERPRRRRQRPQHRIDVGVLRRPHGARLRRGEGRRGPDDEEPGGRLGERRHPRERRRPRDHRVEHDQRDEGHRGARKAPDRAHADAPLGHARRRRPRLPLPRQLGRALHHRPDSARRRRLLRLIDPEAVPGKRGRESGDGVD